MTTRFCPQCGTLLEATAWYGGVCPGCGAKVDVTRGVVGPEGADSAEVATQLSTPDSDTDVHALAAPGMPVDGAATTPAQQSPTASIPVNPSAPRGTSRSRRTPSVWTLMLVSAVVIALVGVSAYSLAPRGVVSIILAPFTAAGASASSSSSSSSSASIGGAPSSSGGGAATMTGKSGGNGAPASPTNTANAGATAAPTTSATPIGVGTVSPEPTVVPTVSATAGPTPVGSPVPGPGVLSVTPTSVTVVDCLLGSGQTTFTVANPGGQPLTWSVSDNGNRYTFSVPGGTLDAGGSTPVTVSHISGAIDSVGNVTFSAPGAQNSPQMVSIKCVV